MRRPPAACPGTWAPADSCSTRSSPRRRRPAGPSAAAAASCRRALGRSATVHLRPSAAATAAGERSRLRRPARTARGWPARARAPARRGSGIRPGARGRRAAVRPAPRPVQRLAAGVPGPSAARRRHVRRRTPQLRPASAACTARACAAGRPARPCRPAQDLSPGASRSIFRPRSLATFPPPIPFTPHPLHPASFPSPLAASRPSASPLLRVLAALTINDPHETVLLVTPAHPPLEPPRSPPLPAPRTRSPASLCMPLSSPTVLPGPGTGVPKAKLTSSAQVGDGMDLRYG